MWIEVVNWEITLVNFSFDFLKNCQFKYSGKYSILNSEFTMVYCEFNLVNCECILLNYEFKLVNFEYTWMNWEFTLVKFNLQYWIHYSHNESNVWINAKILDFLNLKFNCMYVLQILITCNFSLKKLLIYTCGKSKF